MIPVTTYAGRKVAVFGLGGSGLAAAHALAAGGAEIAVWDDNRERVDQAWNDGLPTGDLKVADFAAFDTLVISPGVPLTHPEPHWTVKRAEAAGIPVIGDIELYDTERRATFPAQRLAAITGTNGKSTTTALVGHLLAAMGQDVQVGGNIGRPALDLDPTSSMTVLEVSSFQIDLAPTLAPDVGVLLNVTSDHLDRHGTFERYCAIKQSLIDRSKVAVLGHHSMAVNTYARGFRWRTENAPKLFGFAADPWRPTQAVPRRPDGYSADTVFWDVDYHGGVVVSNRVERQSFDTPPHLRDVPIGWDILIERSGDPKGPLGEIPDVSSLRGVHNMENAAAALAIVMALGLDVEAAIPHLATFPGLPHRMEEVGASKGVRYVNDSKATNLDSAVTALKALPEIYWIAGGKPKPGGLNDLATDRYDIKGAFLIGEAEEDFAKTLEGHVPVARCGTLDAALAAAAGAAEAAGGGTVLLSPACASFDQFRSFEARGDTFRDLVTERLNKETA